MAINIVRTKKVRKLLGQIVYVFKTNLLNSGVSKFLLHQFKEYFRKNYLFILLCSNKNR